MIVTMLQTGIVPASPQENRQNASRLMDQAPGSDLYVLPEMFSTGFCASPEGIAEEPPYPSLQWMTDEARKRGCAIAGSIALHAGDNTWRNRFCFVHPDGKTDFYDKRHLFSYGDEHRRFSAGDRRTTVEYKGVHILPLICYDLRFPVWSRNREDYDMAIYVANWPSGRIEAWKTLLRARAIENQCFVCGVNRTGTDMTGTYPGESALIGPNGNTIADCGSRSDAAVTAEIDMGVLERFRRTFPILKDADKFNIG